VFPGDLGGQRHGVIGSGCADLQARNLEADGAPVLGMLVR
jgi:hypothetical protein